MTSPTKPQRPTHVVMTEADYKAVMEYQQPDPDPLIPPDFQAEAEAELAAERLRALRSQRRSAIPRGCLWWSAWCVVGAGIWVAGILLVASVLASNSPDPIGAATSPVGGANVGAVGKLAVASVASPTGAGPAQLIGLPDGTPRIPGTRVTRQVESAHPAAISHGVASWFDARGYQGAVPWWKAGQQPLWATVSRFADGRTYSVTVLVTGFCQCLRGTPRERVIDLSPAAFSQLAPLSVGLIRVTVEVPVQGPRLPATDAEAVQ